MRLISQLIEGHFKSFPKLLKYFNGTAVLTFFVLPSSGVFPVVFSLDFNDSEFTKVSFVSSLLYCHKALDVSE